MTVSKIGIFGVAAACLIGCGRSPTSPNGKSLVAIAIEPASIEVGAGLSAQLVARGRFSDQTSDTVAVQWTITPNSVATVSSSGELFAVRLGIATVSAIHDTGLRTSAEVKVVNNPANTFPPQDNMTGLWSGQYEVDLCSKVSGPGPDACRFSFGSRLPIQIQLTQTNTILSGQVTIYSIVTGLVSGWRDSGGFFVLFGKLTGQDESAGTLNAEITKWDARAITPANEMSGSFEMIERFGSPQSLQVYRRGGTFLNVRRGS